LKRLTVWVDCDEGELESVRRKIEQYMSQEKMTFTVLTSSEVIYSRKETK